MRDIQKLKPQDRLTRAEAIELDRRINAWLTDAGRRAWKAALKCLHDYDKKYH